MFSIVLLTIVNYFHHFHCINDFVFPNQNFVSNDNYNNNNTINNNNDNDHDNTVLS